MGLSLPMKLMEMRSLAAVSKCPAANLIHAPVTTTSTFREDGGVFGKPIKLLHMWGKYVVVSTKSALPPAQQRKSALHHHLPLTVEGCLYVALIESTVSASSRSEISASSRSEISASSRSETHHHLQRPSHLFFLLVPLLEY
jgi:hypothetical protein